MSSKRFAGEVIRSGCALGFNEICFGFCVFAGLVRFVLFGLLRWFVVSLLDPSIDKSWIYFRSQAQGTMTATIVMMRAAMDKKNWSFEFG